MTTKYSNHIAEIDTRRSMHDAMDEITSMRFNHKGEPTSSLENIANKDTQYTKASSESDITSQLTYKLEELGKKYEESQLNLSIAQKELANYYRNENKIRETQFELIQMIADNVYSIADETYRRDIGQKLYDAITELNGMIGMNHQESNNQNNPSQPPENNDKTLISIQKMHRRLNSIKTNEEKPAETMQPNKDHKKRPMHPFAKININ